MKYQGIAADERVTGGTETYYYSDSGASRHAKWATGITFQAVTDARSAVSCLLTLPRLSLLVVLLLMLLPLPLLLRRMTLLVRLPAAMLLQLLLRLRHGEAPKRHASGGGLLSCDRDDEGRGLLLCGRGGGRGLLLCCCRGGGGDRRRGGGFRLSDSLQGGIGGVATLKDAVSVLVDLANERRQSHERTIGAHIGSI